MLAQEFVPAYFDKLAYFDQMNRHFGNQFQKFWPFSYFSYIQLYFVQLSVKEFFEIQAANKGVQIRIRIYSGSFMNFN